MAEMTDKNALKHTNMYDTFFLPNLDKIIFIRKFIYFFLFLPI